MKFRVIRWWPVLISSQIELKNPVKNRLCFTFWLMVAVGNTNGVNSIDILLPRLILPHRHLKLVIFFPASEIKTVQPRAEIFRGRRTDDVAESGIIPDHV